MSVNERCKGMRAAALLASALSLGACVKEAPIDERDDDSASSEEDPASDDGDRATDEGDVAPPSASKDAGPAKRDGGKTPSGTLDAGTTPIDGTKDASIDRAPDAGTSPAKDAGTAPTPAKDGGAVGPSKDGGAVAGDASTPEPAQCTLTKVQIADSQVAPSLGGFPVLEVNGGVPVRAVGCAQQWEGIVMTMGGRGLCTAAFISDRHLLSASHCYANDGPTTLRVSAPSWDNGASHTFQAQVKRSGSNQALDVSIIDLGKPVEWATPDRRFVLHAGKASAVDMHLYGFGSGGSSGAAGTLRGIPNRATIRVTDNGRGTLSGKAGPAQLCTGDSGGPAFVEKTAPVLYGVNQAIVPSGVGGGRTCASADWTILFTNVSAYLPFVEQALGQKCARTQVDGLDVAQCW